jgi:hypothetical protein
VVESRHAEDRLDVTTISDPDLGDHRLHRGVPFRQGTVTERPLDVADDLRELGRAGTLG